jgi:hypothetical protein
LLGVARPLNIAGPVPDAFPGAASDACSDPGAARRLLTVHSWLVCSSRRGRYAAAAGSALLAGYADAVHSRGLVILAVYLLVWVWIVWRRPAWRGSAVLALAALALPLGVASVLNGRLAAAMYPSGARSLGGEALIRLSFLLAGAPSCLRAWGW